jgi:broad specificity phosphatase PhoE
MRITLVRHAQSAPDKTTPSSTWDLSPEGRTQARRLHLDDVGRLLAGPEPRMASTLIHLGPVEINDRFAESHQGDGWLGEDDFLDAVRRYHAGDPRPEWEPAADVVERFTSGFVDGAAICSGGRAISAVVAHLTGCDGFALWRSLSMPHVIVLDQDEQGRWVASQSHE